MTATVREETEVWADQVRILLAEDQEIVRLGLKLSLQGEEDLSIVGEAITGPSVVSKALELEPSIILMDVGLPGFDGITATRKIKNTIVTKVLMLSSHADEKTVLSSFESGADGYCLKDSSMEKLVAAIRSVSNGGTWIDDDISIKVLKSLDDTDPEITNQHGTCLNEIELSVLNLIFQGAAAKDIAEELQLDLERVPAFTNKVLQKIALSRSKSQLKTGSGGQRRITDDHVVSRVCRTCHTALPSDVEICPEDGCPTEVDELVGTTFADRYDVLSVLGSGAAGAVYKARHKFMNRLVAIKTLHSVHMQDVEVMQRFRQEAQAASTIQHANVVSVLDFGVESSGMAFMIMEYMQGENLGQILDKRSWLAPEEAINIFTQICDGLDFAHEHGIIHRDLKPSNVLVSAVEDGEQRVRLADFGIAKMTSPILEGNMVNTEIGQVFGSPLYMSPEQCKGEPLDRRTDVYSMGCLMYETLVGHPPAIGESGVEVMYKQINHDLPHIRTTERGAKLNVVLQEIVMRALSKDRKDRFPTMARLKDFLACISPVDLSSM